jgi:hypothetical protein
VLQPSASRAEVAAGKLKRYKSPSVYQIPAGGETLCLKINKLIKLIWNREELLHQWKESVVVPIYKKGHKTDCSSY